jgi:hypothetical protein
MGPKGESSIDEQPVSQCTLREGSVAMDNEMLRGVYTERSECAQHDRAELVCS